MCLIEFIDETALDRLLRLPSPLNYDNFASMHFANFDFHRNFAEGNGAMGNDVGAAKSGGRNGDWIEANGRSVGRAVSCKGDWCFEVNFDGN